MSVNYVDKTTGELVTLANGTRMWIGTKEAHDLAVQQGTMPNNCMVCKTNDAAGEEAWEYSTSETNTGKTWIDGKPIYRKVIDCGTIPSSAEAIINTGITNADMLVHLWGVAKSSNCLPLPYVNTDGNSIQLWLGSSMDVLHIRTTSSSWSSYTGYVVVEYTKTTD